MIGFLIYFVILLIVFYVLFYIINLLVVEQPYNNVLKAVLALVFLLCLLNALGVAGAPVVVVR